MNRQKSTRSSRGSNSNASVDSDPREKMKDCCRKLVAFMFTQVGVGGLIVAYAVGGAYIFTAIEGNFDDELNKIIAKRNETAFKIWDVTLNYNNMNGENWTIEVLDALLEHQKTIATHINRRYDFETAKDTWKFPNSLMFCLSVFSMIGYGNCVPKTSGGKIMTMIYATFGIPLYILYFQNMGKVLASTFKWLYTWTHDCSRDQDKDGTSESGIQVKKIGNKRKVIVPSTACLWVMAFYCIGGTVMFGEWEKWKYIDSSYFVITSLCKIGFGDLVPGAAAQEGQGMKLIINFVYILFGMGLVAMCYKLMREEVLEKLREMKEDAKLCMEDVTQKFAKCCGGTGREEEFEERYY
jgi:potassium channel subfamily K, invertebrate